MSPLPLLLVDDDANILEGLRDILEDAGYRVITAGTGQSALAALKKEPAALAILDYQLPDGTGVEWGARLKEISSGLPVVLMTGMASTELQETARERLFAHILTKPVAPAELLKVISKTIR